MRLFRKVVGPFYIGKQKFLNLPSSIIRVVVDCEFDYFIYKDKNKEYGNFSVLESWRLNYC